MKSRLPTFFFALILPFTFMVLGFNFYNTIEPRILGFPFIYAWVFACFGLTSLCLLIAWKLDPLADHNKKKRTLQQR